MSATGPRDDSERDETAGPGAGARRHDGPLNALVRVFLESNLSIVLIVVAVLAGLGALLVTPREEDPQIVVPFADVLVDFPGHSAAQVEQLVTTPLERLLFQVDGVEHVYARSLRDRAIITVRFFVGEDRERSLVKITKRLDENLDLVPEGVTGWIVKPREIDDVPIVALSLVPDDGDDFAARRVAEELAARLADERDISRVEVIGGRPRTMTVHLDPAALEASGLGPDDVLHALRAAGARATAGHLATADRLVAVGVGEAFADADELRACTVGAWDGQPVRLAQVATVEDGPDERVGLVRHGWGPARADSSAAAGDAGAPIGPAGGARAPAPAVTIAIAKKKGTNAVAVSERVLRRAEALRGELVPAGWELVVARNGGLTADRKVNELVEGLGVAIVIVVALLTLGLGGRAAIVVAIAIPVIFGLTLLVNLLAGYTINRVTLFALILALGLIVDDPIVDVENIARLFAVRGRATVGVVLEAVAEIRPPLIVATLAVVASFLPLAFITGMMGPYMAPMALNVPVSMLASMLVAFTITPWLAHRLLRRRRDGGAEGAAATTAATDDIDAVRGSRLDRVLRPVLGALIRSPRRAWTFLAIMGVLALLAAGLGAVRAVPLKMLPFDDRNELLLLLSHDEGTTLERCDAAVRAVEGLLAEVPEVVHFTSHVGLPGPIDFNGLVRQYGFRVGERFAEVRVGLAGKHHRSQQSHAIGLRLRSALEAIAAAHGARLAIVELPPGPPVASTLVAEIRGAPDVPYADLAAAARVVERRLALEPGVVDVDDSLAAPTERLDFRVDREKAALAGIAPTRIADAVALALGGADAGLLQSSRDRQPVPIRLRLPEAARSSPEALSALRLAAPDGTLVPLAELGRWDAATDDGVIMHKDMERVVYVMAEIVGRTPPEVVIDLLADRDAPPADAPRDAIGGVADAEPRAVASRTFLAPGGGVPWWIAEGIDVRFDGEGEWLITLEVFRDLGLAFGAALVAIFVLLAAQFRSFLMPLVVMLAIPLTVIGIMPGFWLLDLLGTDVVGGHRDPVLFTATAMIGMIALSGIVTRQSTILVDFIRLAIARGKPLEDALVAAGVVRLRPILLTASTAMLSAAPIVLDPIFSGLAWSLIFGLGAATVFTVLVIPVVYWLVARRRA